MHALSLSLSLTHTHTHTHTYTLSLSHLHARKRTEIFERGHRGSSVGARCTLLLASQVPVTLTLHAAHYFSHHRSRPNP